MFAALFASQKSKSAIAAQSTGTKDGVLSGAYTAAPAASEPGNSSLTNSNTNSSKDSPLARVQAPVIGVLGAKGGVGSTTIAINLAAALALNYSPVTLIDANLQQPEVAHTAGREPQHSLLELISRMPNADRKMFEACLVEINGSNLGFLSPPLNGEAFVQTNLTNLSQCLKSIRAYSKLWIIDLPRHLDRHLVSLTDTCDKIILVFEATVTGVAAMQRWLSIFHELGYEDSKIICLLNRAGSKYKSIEQRLADCFGGRTIISLPNASSITWDCSTRATTIVQAYPNHPYSRATMQVAQYLSQSILADRMRGNSIV
jgi:pilus assembly protein CpaE